jgi:manganese-dependent inorganic pyrophosphatase
VVNGPLKGETIQSYGKQVIQAGAGLSTRDPQDIVSTDIKIYTAGGLQFVIAQAEVTDLMQLDEHKVRLHDALNELRERRGLDFAMLMITDVVDNTSRLILANAPPILADLPYPKQPDGTLRADGIVSRKKQLLPVVLGLLEA